MTYGILLGYLIKQLWFILRGDLFDVLPCVVLFLCFFCCFILLLFFFFFSPFSIAITSLGEERLSWCFSYVCLICACLVLSVSSSFWKGCGL